MTISQSPARSVLRTKPRRCAHQRYSSGTSRSWASSSAMRFSNPSPASFENGRLFGSAQTRTLSMPCESSPWPLEPGALEPWVSTPWARAPPVASTNAATSTPRLREREDIERPAAARDLRQVLHCIDKAERRGAVARVEHRGYDRAGPAADPGQDRDILLAVRAAEDRRLADDPGAGLEFPQFVAALRIDGFEPAVHRPVEDHIGRGHRSAAPHRKLFLDAPELAPLRDIPGRELAAVAARPGVHPDLGADIGRPGDIADLGVLGVVAQIVVRNVQHAVLWRVGRGLPVLGAWRGGTDIAHDGAGRGLLIRRVLQPAGLQIDPDGRGDIRERLGVEHLAGRAVQQIDVLFPIGMEKRLALLPAEIHVEDDALVDAFIVVQI